MIISGGNWEASYKQETPYMRELDLSDEVNRKVVCWQEIGNKIIPMVVDDEHNVVPANSLPNYLGVSEIDPEFIGIIPCSGVVATGKKEVDGKETPWWDSVIAWAMRSNGDLSPICVDFDDALAFSYNPCDEISFEGLKWVDPEQKEES